MRIPGNRRAIERGSLARVIHIDAAETLLTVRKKNGEQTIYDPRRLHGVSVYREAERESAPRDRIQFTAPDKQLSVANRGPRKNRARLSEQRGDCPAR
jgi:hypothetical protein